MLHAEFHLAHTGVVHLSRSRAQERSGQRSQYPADAGRWLWSWSDLFGLLLHLTLHQHLPHLQLENKLSPAIVCTDLLARGMDLNVDSVISADFPKVCCGFPVLSNSTLTPLLSSNESGRHHIYASHRADSAEQQAWCR